MIKSPALMTIANLTRATENAKRYLADTLARANEMATDARKAARIAKHECKWCFYSSKFGGAAVTTQDCMCCDQPQMYGSTNTDVLCMPCAQKTKLCKHCGGDLELIWRRKWPQKPTATPAKGTI